ncbi:unnamed protein product [Gordionus sp. m RMFG-2023]
MLLQVAAIRTQFLPILIDKMCHYSNNKLPVEDYQDMEIPPNIPILIINEFRKLQNFEREKEFLTYLLDALPKCSVPIQEEILTCLPEFIYEEENVDYVTRRLITSLKLLTVKPGSATMESNNLDNLDILEPLLNTLSTLDVSSADKNNKDGDDNSAEETQTLLLNIVPNLKRDLAGAINLCTIFKFVSYCVKCKQNDQNDGTNQLKPKRLKIRNDKKGSLNNGLKCDAYCESVCDNLRLRCLSNLYYFRLQDAHFRKGDHDDDYDDANERDQEIRDKCIVEIIDTLYNGIKLNEILADTWNKIIDTAFKNNNETLFDLLILILLHENCPISTVNISHSAASRPKFNQSAVIDGSQEMVGSDLFWSAFFEIYRSVVDRHYEALEGLARQFWLSSVPEVVYNNLKSAFSTKEIVNDAGMSIQDSTQYKGRVDDSCYNYEEALNDADWFAYNYYLSFFRSGNVSNILKENTWRLCDKLSYADLDLFHKILNSSNSSRQKSNPKICFNEYLDVHRNLIDANNGKSAGSAKFRNRCITLYCIVRYIATIYSDDSLKKDLKQFTNFVTNFCDPPLSSSPTLSIDNRHQLALNRFNSIVFLDMLSDDLLITYGRSKSNLTSSSCQKVLKYIFSHFFGIFNRRYLVRNPESIDGNISLKGVTAVFEMNTDYILEPMSYPPKSDEEEKSQNNGRATSFASELVDSENRSHEKINDSEYSIGDGNSQFLALSLLPLNSDKMETGVNVKECGGIGQLCPIFRIVWKSLSLIYRGKNPPGSINRKDDVDIYEEMVYRGTLSEIYKLLLCPVYLFDDDDQIGIKDNDITGMLDENLIRKGKVDSDDFIADTENAFKNRIVFLQLALNWFRELLNAFSNIRNSSEISSLLLSRLNHVLLLEKELGQLITTHPHIKLDPSYFCIRNALKPGSTKQNPIMTSPPLHLEAEINEHEDFSACYYKPNLDRTIGKPAQRKKEGTSTSKKKQGSAGKKIKSKKDSDPNEENDSGKEISNENEATNGTCEKDLVVCSSTNSKQSQGKPKSDNSSQNRILILNIRKCLRPLDLSVYYLIRCHHFEPTSHPIQPDQLLFLLQGLWENIENSYPIISPFSNCNTLNQSLNIRKTLSHNKESRDRYHLYTVVIDLLPHLNLCLCHLLNPHQSNTTIIDSKQMVERLKYEVALLIIKILDHFVKNVWVTEQFKGFVNCESPFKSVRSLLFGRIPSRDYMTDYDKEDIIDESFSDQDLGFVVSFYQKLIEVSRSFVLSEKMITLLVNVENVIGHVEDKYQGYRIFMSQKIFYACKTLLSNFGSKESNESMTIFFFPYPLKGQFEISLSKILKLFFSTSSNALELLEDLSMNKIKELLECLAESSENDIISNPISYPTFNKAFFPIYYENMMKELINLIKITTTNHNVKNADELLTDDVNGSQFAVGEMLRQSNLIVKIFHVLVNMIKIFDSRNLLVTTLKLGKVFVETFYLKIVPEFNGILARHSNDIQGLLKNLQRSTRYLHSICGHCKNSKDIVLLNHVPPLKKVLETFVFKVKDMLAKNNCSDAFWLGNLKHRDLQGIEISSQINVTQRDDL